jgi:hypothetical protein
MTNWLVTIVSDSAPFGKKKVVVPAESIIEALGTNVPGYTAISAAFHSSYMSNDLPNHSYFLGDL